MCQTGQRLERNFQRTVKCLWKQVYVVDTGLQVGQQLKRPGAPHIASMDTILAK